MKRLLNLFLLLTMFVVNAAAVDYPFFIAGTRVTSSNASNVLGDGTVSYNDASKTLTLNNANLEGTENVIYYYETDVTITVKLIGKNTVKATRNAIRSGGANFTITGGGTLNANGINLGDGSLTVSGSAKVNVLKSNYYGISGCTNFSIKDNAELNVEGNGKDETLKVKNSPSLAEGFLLHPIKLYHAAGGIYYDGLNSLTKGDVKIYNADNYKKYALEIEQVQLNEVSASDVYGDGSVKYDDDTKTLMLNNAKLGGDSHVRMDYIIKDYRYDGDLTINLIGTNTVERGWDLAALITDGANVIIAGDGTINIDGIDLDEGNLTIKGNAKVDVNGHNYNAINLRGASLSVFDKAMLDVHGNDRDETLLGIKTLAQGNLVYPGSLSYSSTKQGVVDKTGNLTKGDVKIYNADNFKKYMLSIEGSQLNEINAADVYGDGTVKYDDATKTLTLNNANLSDVCDVIHDFDYNETITINLIGKNTIKADYDALSSDGASYIITGDGTFNVNGVNLDEGNLTIKDKAKVNVLKSTSFAVNLRGADLSVLDNAELNAEGNGKDETFWGIGKLTLGKGFLVHPINLSYSSTKQSIVDDAGNRTKGDVKIYNADNLKKFALAIEGVQLNELNAADPCGDGSVNYDDATKTLTLDNANLSGVSDVITDYRYDGDLTINLIGANIVKANLTALRTDGANVIITGDGTLNVSGINLDEGNLTIKGKAKVNVLKSNSYAINLRGANLSVLDKSELNIEGNGIDETVWGVNNLYLENGLAAIPQNISYSSTKHTFVDENGNATKGDIKICYDPSADLYDLWIAGTQVSAANANDVFGDGTVKVEKGSNGIIGEYYAITLNDANLISSSTAQKGVIYSTYGINILCVGTNSIEAQGDVNAAIYSEKYVGVTGSGLNIKGKWNGISAESVEIRNINLNVEGINSRGIGGFWGAQDGYLIIYIDDNSIVKVKGGIEDFPAIYYTKMEADADICIYDFGSQFDHNLGIVTNDGQHNIYRDEIRFSNRNSTSISGIQSSGTTDAPAYDLMGRKVNNSYRGIVIKNGKKMMVK